MLRVRLAELLLSRNNWTRKRFNLFFYLHVQKIIEVFRYLNIGRLSIDIPHQKATVLLYFFSGLIMRMHYFFVVYISWIIFIVKVLPMPTPMQNTNIKWAIKISRSISYIKYQSFNCLVQHKIFVFDCISVISHRIINVYKLYLLLFPIYQCISSSEWKHQTENKTQNLCIHPYLLI